MNRNRACELLLAEEERAVAKARLTDEPFRGDYLEVARALRLARAALELEDDVSFKYLQIILECGERKGA